MGLFEQFPYANFHELNLDWILKKIKELDEKVDSIEDRILKISIHGPRAGRDAPVACRMLSWTPFQSTRPVRGATAVTHTPH